MVNLGGNVNTGVQCACKNESSVLKQGALSKVTPFLRVHRPPSSQTAQLRELWGCTGSSGLELRLREENRHHGSAH